MDDNMGLGTPNFFSSAWNPEQSDFSFTESYPTDGGSYAGYAQNFQLQTEQDQIDYFSGHPGNQFRTQSYGAGFGSDFLDSNDDLNQILDNSLGGKGILDMGISQDATQLAAAEQSLNPLEISNQVDQAHNPLGLEALSIDPWGLDRKSSSAATRLGTEIVKTNERKTSILHGQITPGDSPLEEQLPRKDSLKTAPSTGYSPKHSLTSRKRKTQPTAPNKREPENSANAVPKVKRPRKSKKKPLTKEQEEAKRKKFLERNRVAADKCRQNRKKWIDDLQAKAHFFTADNAAKKAALEKLEHDISQLKALLFVHSGRCSDKNIASWLEQESARVKQRAETMPQHTGSDVDQGLDDIMLSPSRPSSSRGFGNATDAASATNSEDHDSLLSTSCDSNQCSRRSSTTTNGITRQIPMKLEK
jgi:hypothetical protein